MDDGNGEKALREAQEYLHQFRPFIEAMVGTDPTDELLTKIAEDVPAFLDSPKTWAAKIEDLVAQGISDTKFGESIGSLVRLLPGLRKLGQKLHGDVCSQEIQLVSKHRGAQRLLHVIADIAKENEKQTILRCFPVQCANALPSLLGVYPGLGKLIRRGTDDADNITFEELVGTLASHMSHASETFYRPMLESALLITQIGEGRQPKAPSMLGATMFQCRKLWDSRYPDLFSLLLDPIRILRNSEAHRLTEIDPRAETVTFVNQRTDGTQEVLGPLDREGFQALIQDFLKLSMAMKAAFDLAKARIASG